MKIVDVEAEVRKLTKETKWSNYFALENLLFDLMPIADLIRALEFYNSPKYRIISDYDYEDGTVWHIAVSEEESNIDFANRKERLRRQLTNQNKEVYSTEEKELKEYRRLQKKYGGKIDDS